MSGKRGRRLSDDERALWRDVTRSVAPLRDDAAASEDEAVTPDPDTPPVKKPLPAPVAAVQREKPAITPQPALAPLGQKFRRKLVRGTESIDARIDLHGMTQDQAHHALTRFLHRAQGDGAKIVLVITGKGLRGEGSERGVLRRQVPLWLRLPEFRAVVVGFEDAHVGHGGEGAMYVRIRRSRSTRE